jgi:hypothetical protein
VAPASHSYWFQSRTMLRYENIRFDYEPYPIGVAAEVFEPKLYDKLLATYPDLKLFQHMPKLGNKYSLSESNNGSVYEKFLKSSPEWQNFHDYIKSRNFIENTLEMLEKNHIKLALRHPRIVSRSGRSNRKTSILGRLMRWTELNARFEFSAMGGDGGHIRPHTDMPRKMITFVFSIVGPNEWDSKWGGSTDVVWPKDIKTVYNEDNHYSEFDQVNTLKKFNFVPNQAVVFIKTWNSWHAVEPIKAPSPNNVRRTLTVNIERAL